jgi:hypothetical protein
VDYLGWSIEVNRTAASGYLLGDLASISRGQWVAAGKAIAFGLRDRERPRSQKDETLIFDPVVATSQMTGAR